MREQDIQSFMQAAYDVAKDQPGWRAQAPQIVQQMGLDRGALADEEHPHTRRYQELARRCEDGGLIERRDDHYQLVRVTDIGKQYVESGFMYL